MNCRTGAHGWWNCTEHTGLPLANALDQLLRLKGEAGSKGKGKGKGEKGKKGKGKGKDRRTRGDAEVIG